METTATMISSIATAVSAVVATATLVLAFLKYHERSKAEHADRMFDLLMRIRKDSDTVEFLEKSISPKAVGMGMASPTASLKKSLTMPCSNLNTSYI